MTEPKAESGSKALLSGVLIALSGFVVFAAIIVPPYLRKRSEIRWGEALVARAQPVLDALITAEAAYKEREGKFWRDKNQTLAAEATKQSLGVDISKEPALRFAIDPPDLVADPTLRIDVKGTGEAEGFAIQCVYDSIQRTKTCKR
jgi:hypothetical protein